MSTLENCALTIIRPAFPASSATFKSQTINLSSSLNGLRRNHTESLDFPLLVLLIWVSLSYLQDSWICGTWVVPEMDKANRSRSITSQNPVSSDQILLNTTIFKIYMHIRTSIHLHLSSWWKISSSTGIHYRSRGKERRKGKKNNVTCKQLKGGSISKLSMRQIREPKYAEVWST
jgi:hypothetical protein